MRSTSSPDQINLVFDIEPEPAPPAVKVEAVEVRPQPMPVDLPESAWGPLDRKILESAVKPIAGSVLYDKSRHSNLGRKYFYTRRDYLVAQGKLHTWTEEPSNGRPTTYYCVNPPSKPDPSSIIADVEVAAEAVDPPGAIDLYTKKQFRQSAMAGFGDSRPMEEVFSGLSVKDLFWAQWQDTKWMTTNEVAAFLGLTPRAIDKNFQRNRDEFIEAGEVQKLEKQALRDFRDATDSESVASGEHGIPARASQSNIYNMAGVLRMAWISEGEMGRAVRNATMQLIHSIPAMVKQAADNGRNSQLDTISTGDLASNVIADRLTDLTMVIQSLAEKVEAIAPVSVKVEQKVDRVEEKVDIVVKKLKAEREPFRDSVKREAARIFLKIHPDGRDIFDDSLIINPKTGNPTKACDFDHFNLEGKQRQDGTIRNCAPLSRDTHRRKHGSCSDPFTVDEWQKFKNFHGAWQHQIDTEERCKPYQPGLPIEPN